MIRNIFFSLFTILSFNCYSQVAGLNYARNLGGSETDMFHSNALLRNGNVVSVGFTQSTDGHAAGNHGKDDCFVVCTSPEGFIIWKKLIGGTEMDGTSSDVDTTADGNIVVGFSAYSNNGDITGNHGEWDVAFFKFSPEGNLIWKKIYGGAASEIFGSLAATPDGGIIASAGSNSTVSGNVSGTNRGANDLWIIKLDVNGNIEWEKLYGGSLDEMAAGSAGGAVALADDGGYFFSTCSNSVDGDLAGVLPPGAVMGPNDIWLSHISVTGNILWSKYVGGSEEETVGVLHSHANSLYFAFTSKSGDRDLQGNLGLYDIALFKYNTAGTLLWKKQYASLAWDNLGDLTSFNGDMLTMTGGNYSHSFAGYPMPSADERLMVFRIDTLNGNIKWMKGLGGNGRSAGSGICINNKGQFFISGICTNTIGDIYNNLGGYDAVVLSFAGGNRFTGTVFVDLNNNNLPDAGEERPDQVIVRADKSNEMFYLSSTRNGGQYSLEVDTGIYKVKADLKGNPYYTVVPADFSWQFLNNNESYNKNIVLHAVPNIRDLTINLAPMNILRPGRIVRYLLTGYNVGTTGISSGTIGFRKDPSLSFADFSVPPAYQDSDSVSWNFNNLAPFDSLNFAIGMMVPTTAQHGEPMNYVLGILPLASDATPVNNIIHFRHIVVNSFDPNCKSNNWGDSIPLAAVQKEDFIYYTIQFQNTGTASAIDIFIKDTLSDKLLDSTLQIVKTSHAGSFSLKDKVATWTFFNINLPDSNANEKASHGFIQFRVKPKKTLAVREFIDNTAAIYFDFNPPVITENNRVTVYVPAIIIPPTPPAPVVTPAGNITFCTSVLLSTAAGNGYQWFKDGIAIAGATSNSYNVQSPGAYTVTRTVNSMTSSASAATTVTGGLMAGPVISETANNVLKIQNPDAAVTYTWQMMNGSAWADIDPIVTGNLYNVSSTGDYRVRAAKGFCTSVSNMLHKDIVVPVTLTELKVYPNPATHFVTVKQGSGENWLTAEVFNFIGEKMIVPVSFNGQAAIKIDVSNFKAGAYVVVLKNEKGNTQRVKFVKQ